MSARCTRGNILVVSLHDARVAGKAPEASCWQSDSDGVSDAASGRPWRHSATPLSRPYCASGWRSKRGELRCRRGCRAGPACSCRHGASTIWHGSSWHERVWIGARALRLLAREGTARASEGADAPGPRVMARAAAMRRFDPYHRARRAGLPATTPRFQPARSSREVPSVLRALPVFQARAVRCGLQRARRLSEQRRGDAPRGPRPSRAPSPGRCSTTSPAALLATRSTAGGCYQDVCRALLSRARPHAVGARHAIGARPHARRAWHARRAPPHARRAQPHERRAQPHERRAQAHARRAWRARRARHARWPRHMKAWPRSRTRRRGRDCALAKTVRAWDEC
jgi:hypothetical protein